MYCVRCGESVEEIGGTQMRDCYHFLCTDCIVKAVKRASTPRIPCEGYNGIYRCTGYLEQEELECMVPDKVYAKYLQRVMTTQEEDWQKDDDDNDDDVENQEEEGAFANLDLTEEEKNCGWAHKVALIDDLVRNEGYTFKQAEKHLDMLPILENRSVIRCSICWEDIQPGGGVVLKDCLHMFCKDCVGGHIRACETAVVECPFGEDNVNCDEPLKLSEVAALGGNIEVQRHFEQLSLKEAEASMENVAHCLTPNCIGFVVADPGVRQFDCPVCRTRNCMDCKISHPGTCAQYKQEIADDVNRRVQRENDVLSENAINQNLNRRIFMRCPKCNTVIEKNGGCPNMVCHNRGCAHQFVWTGVPA